MSDRKELTHAFFRLIDEMQSGRTPWSRFDEMITSDFRAFVPGQTLDVAGFKNVMQTFAASFTDSSHTITDLLVDGDGVAVREVWQGTHVAEFLGAKPTNQRVESVVMALLKFKGDKVYEFHETFDTLDLMQKTGVIKPS